MALKLFLNVFYTVGIFVCCAVIYWAWPLHRYEFVLGSIFVAGLFIIFKIKLLRDLKQPPGSKL